MSDKSQYPWFFRTAYSPTKSNPLRIKLLEAFGWKKAAFLMQITPSLVAVGVTTKVEYSMIFETKE